MGISREAADRRLSPWWLLLPGPHGGRGRVAGPRSAARGTAGTAVSHPDSAAAARGVRPGSAARPGPAFGRAEDAAAAGAESGIGPAGARRRSRDACHEAGG